MGKKMKTLLDAPALCIVLLFQATAFLEPYSSLIHNAKPYTDTIPGLMYGTELSEKGITHCNVPGYDYLQFYKLWQCPKLALEVAVSTFVCLYVCLSVCWSRLES